MIAVGAVSPIVDRKNDRVQALHDDLYLGLRTTAVDRAGLEERPTVGTANLEPDLGRRARADAIGQASVGETRGIGQSRCVVAGGQPQPSGPSIAPCTFVRQRPGAGCVAPPSSQAQAAPHRGPPTLSPPRLRYLLACPVAAPSALVLVSEHLEA